MTTKPTPASLEFDFGAAKVYAVQTCMNSPYAGFDLGSITTGARWQHSQLLPLIQEQAKEIEAIANQDAFHYTSMLLAVVRKLIEQRDFWLTEASDKFNEYSNENNAELLEILK